MEKFVVMPLLAKLYGPQQSCYWLFWEWLTLILLRNVMLWCIPHLFTIAFLSTDNHCQLPSKETSRPQYLQLQECLSGWVDLEDNMWQLRVYIRTYLSIFEMWKGLKKDKLHFHRMILNWLDWCLSKFPLVKWVNVIGISTCITNLSTALHFDWTH